ncbi:hypothetical protein AcW2_006611 [Taiwanofungus camphoratus]|nr:hypothetical protein AcW2_006611 [Antrodia cinnamomea]
MAAWQVRIAPQLFVNVQASRAAQIAWYLSLPLLYKVTCTVPLRPHPARNAREAHTAFPGGAPGAPCFLAFSSRTSASTMSRHEWSDSCTRTPIEQSTDNIE